MGSRTPNLLVSESGEVTSASVLALFNSPMDTPQWEPQKLMLLSEMAAMRIWSKARVKKAPKALQKGTVRLRVAQPTATLTCEAVGRSQCQPQRGGRGWPESPEPHTPWSF